LTAGDWKVDLGAAGSASDPGGEDFVGKLELQ
jgi:hypothetical protein